MVGGSTAAISAIALVLQMSSGQATAANTGHVVGAPHGGYDQNSGRMATNIARRLGWGWVRATGYRSYPLHYWYDVNRPTERPYRGGGFIDGRETSDARRIYSEYQRKLKSAARRTGTVDFLVEIHGHSRSVRAGGRDMRVQVIELATRGFTLTKLRQIKRRFDDLVADLPASQRVTLAIDRLDSRFEYRGWLVPFFFRATGAKNTGSLRTSQASKTLHFELPPRVRETWSSRRAYERLLATVIEEASRP